MNRIAYLSLLLSCSLPLPSADSAEFFGLGDFVPPTGFESGLNLSGDGATVFGGFFDNWYWTRETGWKHPHDEPPRNPTTAFAFAGLSTTGIAAGAVSPPIGRPGRSDPTAVRWDQENGIERLGYLPGHNRSWASAISQDGNTILGRSWQGNEDGQAFMWTVDSGMQAIPDLDGSYITASDAAGNFYGSSGTQAFEWSPQTGVQTLEVPRSFRDVSADGSTFVGVGDSSLFEENFLVWNRDSGFIDVDDQVPESWQYSFATGVSADGSRIVGRGGRTRLEWIETAFLYTPEHGVSMFKQQIGLAFCGDSRPSNVGVYVRARHFRRW